MASTKTINEVDETKVADNAASTSNVSKASTKAKPEKKTQVKKEKETKEPKEPKKTKKKQAEADNVDGTDENVDAVSGGEGGEGETTSANKLKLSAVPMPLVKKVKEQLDGIQFKNLNELKTVLETFVNVIVETTKDGTSVTLPNYMTFKRVYRNERRHKNPKTKEEIIKPEHYVMSMYVKSQLKKQFEDIPITDRPAPKQNTTASSEDK